MRRGLYLKPSENGDSAADSCEAKSVDYCCTCAATRSGTPDPGQALVCITTNVNTKCCRGSDGGSVGDWFFPDGTRVPRGNDDPITRTGWTHQVRLSRRNNAMTPTGDHECRVPDENSGLIHTASITLVLGECSMIMPQVYVSQGGRA